MEPMRRPESDKHPVTGELRREHRIVPVHGLSGTDLGSIAVSGPSWSVVGQIGKPSPPSEAPVRPVPHVDPLPSSSHCHPQ